MEAGVKQMETLGERLVDTIQTDPADFELRLGMLEDPSKALRKHKATMDRMHSKARIKELNLANAVQQIQASHG